VSAPTLFVPGRPAIYPPPPKPSSLPEFPVPVFAPPGTGGTPNPITNPMTALNFISGMRQNLINSQTQRPLVRLWDFNHNFIGDITQELSVKASKIYNDSGQCEINMRAENWLGDWIIYDRLPEQDLHITIDPIPTMRTWNNRWGGKVTTANLKRDEQGIHTIQLQGTHNREHIKHLLFGASPLLPPELQIPTIWLLPWNLRTGMFLTGFTNLARQFFPLLTIPDNIANPTAWISSDLEDLNPLGFPIQWQFVDPVLDQSRVEIIAARWADAQTSLAALLEDAGCIIDAYVFLAGEDTTSPHPELAALIGNDLAMPTRNCIVLAGLNKSGVTGPTGTFLDGFINFIASTGDDLITDVLIPQFDPDGTGQTNPLIAALFGVAPQNPWIIYKDTTYSGIIESNRAIHGATAKTVMTGGNSPGWVNELITFGIKYGLAELSSQIGQGLPVFQASGTPGLDSLYQGQLDNTVLAFERYSDPIRELWCGDMGFLEEMQTGTGTAYTVSGVLSLRAGDWKTRAYTSYKTTVRNAAPYFVGFGAAGPDTLFDYGIGDRIGFQMANVIYTDQASVINMSWDVNTPVNYEVGIGTDSHEIDPVAQAVRAIAGIWNTFGVFAGAQNLF
jgi:hypothetical protein